MPQHARLPSNKTPRFLILQGLESQAACLQNALEEQEQLYNVAHSLELVSAHTHM